ncbi:MAG TPA: EF-Tu/IF-2/RF-3 family GTPase, partial [bacterium]|nr:EF-Tu/IF-2/RF-3 family GTPase [bacterium]
FMDLGANYEQMDFTTVYAIAKDGVAIMNLADERKDLTPLLDTILEKVPTATIKEDEPFTFQAFNLAYDNYLGRMGVGRVYHGKAKVGQKVLLKKHSGETIPGTLTKIFSFEGTSRKEVDEVEAGDIVMLAGLPDLYIGDTVCINAEQALLPEIKIDEPTISLNFLVNSSPFAGREGKMVTNSQIRERLERELKVNVGLKIDFSAGDYYKVYGRGELHIVVLLENMRREGYEVQVSQPQVIIKEENGITVEPFEEVTIDIHKDFTGMVIDKLAKRKGQLVTMQPEEHQTRLIYHIPTRGILGYRGEFVVDTRGEGILCTEFIGFKPFAGDIEKRQSGSMISGETGKALAYSLANLQERGNLYIEPNTDIYEGMIIGDTAKGLDMTVNPIKGKKLTNMRSSNADMAIQLTRPDIMTLEKGLEIMAGDEYLEVTPKSVRLRKQLLTEMERARGDRSK